MNERQRESFSEITGQALTLFGLILIILSLAAISDQRLSNGPIITGAGGLIGVGVGGLTWRYGHNLNLSGILG